MRNIRSLGFGFLLCLLVIAGFSVAQEPTRQLSPVAAQLKQIHVALVMYSNDFRGHVPPNFGANNNSDYLYLGSRTGAETRMARLDRRLPLVMTKLDPEGKDESITVLFADGTIQEYVPKNPSPTTRPTIEATTQRAGEL